MEEYCAATRCGAVRGDRRAQRSLRAASAGRSSRRLHPFYPFVQSLLLTLPIPRATGRHLRAAPVAFSVKLQRLFVRALTREGVGATGAQREGSMKAA